uniref:Uncharacterized protein n=1 Tax=Avena sativa TaxID=4498 RepID=A0ACD6A406_AVESA
MALLVELFETGVTVACGFFLEHYVLVGLGLLFWLAGRLLEKLWWKPRRLERALRSQGLRGTSYRFLVGDLPLLGQKASSKPWPLRCHDNAPRLAPFLYNIAREHGKTSMFWFGPMPNVVINDTSVVKEILSGKHEQIVIPKFEVFGKLLGNGLSSQDGEKWVQHRKIMAPSFHLPELKLKLSAFSSCCQDLVSRWTNKCIGMNNGGGSCELDIWPELRNLTGDVLSRVAFGSSYLEGMRVFHLQEEQAERLMSAIWTTAHPAFLYLPIKNNRRMHQINKEIETIIRGIIVERIQAMNEGGCTRQDLLDMMLESNLSGIEGNDKSSSGMTIEEAIHHLKFLYFAGMDPSAVLLTWTIVMLSMHPEWQERAREEVLGLFGKNKPTYEDMSRLKIVTMILREVLRLYPPTAQMKRKTIKEVELGGVRYPAGVMIDIPILLMHHDIDNWGNDVHEFKPERFANGVAEASKNPGAFIPFGAGPRICVGQNFTMLEGKMAICMILQHFQFELGPSYTHAPHYVVTLHPTHGVHIKLKAI